MVVDDELTQTSYDTIKTDYALEEDYTSEASGISIPVNDGSSIDEIEQKVIEHLEKNEDGFYMCNLCGKVGDRRNHMKNHIETHLDGISVSCSICKKQFGSRNSHNVHMSRNHKK